MRKTATDDEVLEEVAEGVFLSQLPSGANASMQFARVRPGGTVPKHSHENEQYGYVLSGEVVFVLDDGECAVRADEAYVLAANEPHGVENRADEEAVVLELLSPKRGTPDWSE